MKTVQSGDKPDDRNHLRLRRDARELPLWRNGMLLRNQGWERIREHFIDEEKKLLNDSIQARRFALAAASSQTTVPLP
jgi:hypothetical protein